MVALASSPAVLSEDGRYRYFLSRRVSLAPGIACWVMLNPSKADAMRDDPTIRRCRNFTREWGYGTLWVVNLYGFRATDPRDLALERMMGRDPVGPDNDRWLLSAADSATVLIAAWGAIPRPMYERADAVLKMLRRPTRSVFCLGETNDGHPRHPVRLAGATALEIYEGEYP